MQSLNGQAVLYLMMLIAPRYLTRSLCSQDLGLMVISGACECVMLALAPRHV